MYLINAIYFKGIWRYKFDSKLTKNMNFNLNEGRTITTPFMNQKGTFEYMKNENFSAVNLPYGNSNFSMFIMLPNDGNTCNDIINSMNDQKWASWNQSLSKQEIEVSLPRFKFEFFKDIKEELTGLGMDNMFGSAADLSGITKRGGIAVSRVLHKTFVEVNEEGTEAAAVTAVEIKETASAPLVFKADKPFIFVIREKDTNCLLFMGIMNNPALEMHD